MKVFLDSSALAKRYIEEKGSDKVFTLLEASDELGVSIICLPEIISALNRIKKEKKITTAQYLTAKQAIVEDVRDASICNIAEGTVAKAVYLLEENVLRTMDAFHIASALEWKCDVFASADKQQIKAAKKAGLKVEDVS